MITKEQLESIDYRSNDGREYFGGHGAWDFMFDIRTQILWDYNDGLGEPDFITKTTNFENLKKVLTAVGGI